MSREIDTTSEAYQREKRIAHARAEGAWKAHCMVEVHGDTIEEVKKVAFLALLAAWTPEERAFASGFDYRVERMTDRETFDLVTSWRKEND